MKHIIKNQISLLSLLLVVVFGFAFASCSDDDDNGGTPEITGVRLCDPAKADSLFSKPGPGSTIAIVFHHLLFLVKFPQMRHVGRHEHHLSGRKALGDVADGAHAMAVNDVGELPGGLSVESYLFFGL